MVESESDRVVRAGDRSVSSGTRFAGDEDEEGE